MKKGDRLCKKIFWAFLALLWPVAAAVGQSHQDSSQSSPQSASQTQSQPEQKKSEAGGDATKKSEKVKAKPKKVYTEEDLSGMRGNDVSIVGDEKPAGGSAGAKKADGKTTTGVVPMSGRDEAYWRGKARVLLDQIAATEQQIAKLKGDIKKYGAGGFDVTTGMKNSVAYIEDRNGQVKELEREKAALEKKVDQLQEEGRKAGAEPAWFR
jgi:chromosome segregation ATPase